MKNLIAVLVLAIITMTAVSPVLADGIIIIDPPPEPPPKPVIFISVLFFIGNTSFEKIDHNSPSNILLL